MSLMRIFQIQGLGRSSGGGNGKPLQYCLENPMGRGTWRATVHRTAKNETRLKQLSMHAPTCDLPVPESSLQYSWASLVAQLVKNLCAMQETLVQFLGWEDSLEKGKLPTSVFWPGEFHGLYSSWGLPLWLSWLRIRLQCGRPGFNPWVGKMPWRRDGYPSIHGMAKSQTHLSDFHFYFHSPWGHQRVGHD